MTLVYELHYVFSPLFLVPLAIALGIFFSPQLSRWVDSMRDEPRGGDAPLSNRERYVFSALALAFFVLLTANNVMHHRRLADAYESDRYSEVTGVVENHHKPLKGDPYERFTIGGVSFAYTDDNPGVGYCGPVTPGETYRICYVLDQHSGLRIILRLEHLGGTEGATP